MSDRVITESSNTIDTQPRNWAAGEDDWLGLSRESLLLLRQWL